MGSVRQQLMPWVTSASLLLAGCAGAPTTSTGPEPAAAVAAEAATSSEVTAEATIQAEAPVAERPIPPASLYPLLLAEFALRRRDFDTALSTYLEQAKILRDPDISKRATNLAQYLQREPAVRQAVALWVELEPDSVEANSTLATLLARQGRGPDALAYLATVARAGHPAPFPIILNGFEALPEDQQRALDEALQALIDEGLGNDQGLRLTHAMIAENTGRPELALTRLEALFALDPFQAQGLLVEARLRQALELPEPFKRLEAALEAQPDNSRLRLQYARLLARDNMELAREQFEILSVDAPTNADLLFSLALLNHELEDDTAARRYLGQLIDMGERKDEAWFYLGQIAMENGETDAALDAFRQVGDGPQFLNATANIGRLLLRNERSAEFGSYMDRLRQGHPQRVEQLFALQSSLLSEARRDPLALEVLNRAIESFPESENLYYARSIIHEREGNLGAAEGDLRRIIESDPTNATALNALGYTLANRTERLEEARELIERALALQPEEPAILDSMGWVLFRLGEYPDALRYLQRAYERFPDPEVAAHLGEVMWVTGDADSARSLWRSALAENPGHAVLRATLERLGVSIDSLTSP